MNQLTRTARSRLRAFLHDTRTRACAAATALFGALSLFLSVCQQSEQQRHDLLPAAGLWDGISSGRWLLHLLGKLTEKLWGVYNVPLFSGLLALLLLALTSAVLVRALDIRSRALSFALAAVTASAAPIASLMLFQFTVHYYALALLLIASAACLMRSRKPFAFAWRFPAGRVLAWHLSGVFPVFCRFAASDDPRIVSAARDAAQGADLLRPALPRRACGELSALLADPPRSARPARREAERLSGHERHGKPLPAWHSARLREVFSA